MRDKSAVIEVREEEWELIGLEEELKCWGERVIFFFLGGGGIQFLLQHYYCFHIALEENFQW